MSVVIVDRSGEIHHMTGISITNRGVAPASFSGTSWAGAAGNPGGAHNIPRPGAGEPRVVSTAPHGTIHTLAQVDRVVDLRPGKLLVAEFR